jgi:outer membrane protein assembly factor BamD (BamD/ComL family)
MAGCASSPAAVPGDITAEELVQRAQEASDRYHYRQALQYYELVMSRYSYNIEMVCTAEYETALIYYKQKKYGLAREQFDALLLRYAGADAELLPPKFKRLSGIMLENINKKAGPPAPGEAETPANAE